MNNENSMMVHFVGGTTGGMAQVLVGHPFDTIKVRLQTDSSYRNAFDCFSKMCKTEGLKGFYKGVISPLTGIGICNAVLFTTNKKILSLIDKDKIQNNIGRVSLCGGIAGCVMSFVNCPIELVKIRMQIQRQIIVHTILIFVGIKFTCLLINNL